MTLFRNSFNIYLIPDDQCIIIVMLLSLQFKERKMNKSSTIQARIDPRVKSKAQKILNKLNISMSEAISIFLTQVSLKKGIPFEIKIPNELTEKTLTKSENGEDLHMVSDRKQLLKELNN